MSAVTSQPVVGAAAGETDRYVVLDGLRGLAAMAIIIHHFSQVIGSQELFASATISVDFFFCLSGFVIAHAYHGRLVQGMPLGDFVRRRIARLYPMYIVGTVLGVAAMLLLLRAGLTNHSPASIATATALNLFYVPYLNERTVQVFVEHIDGMLFPMNGPAWSLLFGMIANLCYATSLRFSQRLPLLIAAISATLLCAATIVYGEAPGWSTENVLGGFPRVLFSFFAGIVLFQYRDHLLRRLPRFNAIAVVVLVAAVVAVPRFAGHRYYWLGMVLFAVPLFVALGARSPATRGTLIQRALTYAGSLSYTLFCIHFPLIMLWSLVVPAGWPRAVVAGGYLAVTLLAAHVLSTRVEGPMRAWLSARLRPR